MKNCIDCNNVKPLTEFYKDSKSKDGHGRYCKHCMAIRYVNSRHKKLDHYKEVQKTRITGTLLKVREWKKERGCCVCGVNEPYCLDLHHLDPSIKEGHPSDFVRVSFKKFLDEAKKCVVVCRNCHAKIHAGIISL